jgi:hypothetical protein
VAEPYFTVHGIQRLYSLLTSLDNTISIRLVRWSKTRADPSLVVNQQTTSNKSGMAVSASYQGNQPLDGTHAINIEALTIMHTS